MEKKCCSKCNTEKSLKEFNWRDEQKGWRHSFCKTCHAKYRKKHYHNNKDKYIHKASAWNKKQTALLREFILAYLKSHSCVDCGLNDIRVLDFDHVKGKFMGISVMVRRCHSIDSIKKEIEKCDVRCANCHRIKTFERGNYWKIKMGE